MDKFIEDQDFHHINFSLQFPEEAEYDTCSFTDCDFTGVDLSGFSFSECTFTACNLSMNKLNKTAFRDISFKQCKLVGLHFEDCSDFLFEVSFEDCVLQVCSFYKRNLKKTNFIRSEIKETDFTEANLSEAVFDRCDLALSKFEHCNLEKADFRTSFHLILDPELNKMKKARFALTHLPGLLTKYDIRIG